MWAQALNALVGAWLMAAPEVVGYGGWASLNAHVVGPIAATIAAIAAFEVTRPARWALVPLGAWLLIAPWGFGYAVAPLLDSTAAGLLLIAFGTVPGVIRERFGGGWLALWKSSGAAPRPDEAEGRTNGPTRGGRPRRLVVVVTGASAGIGRATARAFAARGASIGLIARGLAGLEAARRDVEAAGGQALVLPLDVSDADAVEEAAAQVEAAFGPIDVWVNNAMLSVFSTVLQMEPREYRRVTEVTYLGYVHGSLAALRRMKPRDQGVIIQVGSALAYRGIPLQSAYCAAKHAIQGFNDSLRAELIHDGSRVKVRSVHLSAFNTPQFRWVKSRLPRKGQPVPPIYQPEVAARAILWAVEHDRRELPVGWPAMKAIWGNRLLPAYADRAAAWGGYESQQTDEPRDPDRPHNLWEPVDRDEDHGAHGAFDDRARDRSLQLWLTMHRGPVARGLAVAAALACVAALLSIGA
jgi:NAD(P)-dependent dehydrogenase (short-subunit alcohol dehydrogenase family)